MHRLEIDTGSKYDWDERWMDGESRVKDRVRRRGLG